MSLLLFPIFFNMHPNFAIGEILAGLDLGLGGRSSKKVILKKLKL